jgi:hypothetical protein
LLRTLFQVHLWNLRREKAIHLIGPENETEQEQVVRMEKVAALEVSFIDHKARYKDAIVGAIDFAKSCKATSDEQFPNYNTPRYIGYLSGLKPQLAQMDPFNAESYEDEVEIPPPLKYYRQKSPSDISRFWDRLWTQDNCISFYLPFARTVAVDQMRRDEDGMADWMRVTFIQACHSTWDNAGFSTSQDADEMYAVWELHACEIAYERGTHMRDTPVRWPMRDARL